MTLSIKDHIEAGHYERDEKGRALVPVSGVRPATICATDAPGPKPIIGFIRGASPMDECAWVLWDEHGNNCPSQPRACWVDLLPPPPRKVEVKRWLRIATWDGRPYVAVNTMYEERPQDTPGHIIIELTGSYEQEW